MPKNYIFTSESVCSGHPDKICDRISDSIVDEVLSLDKSGKVAVETLVTKNKCILAGEVTCHSKIDFENIARKQIKELGYTSLDYGFSDKSDFEIYIHEQSPEIAVGVNSEGAGDQGMMFGFACKDTPNFMPMPIEVAHLMAKQIDHLRETKQLPYLRPDGKTQVSIGYENGLPKKVTSVVLAVPHSEEVSLDQVKSDLYENVAQAVLTKFGFILDLDNLIVNGTGVWHKGGPASDTGVTGRKIIVDTYGGFARVGGGAFSGKDPTKVDRSGAYAARFIAKNLVANGLCDKAEVRLAYCIGIKETLMQEVETFGTENVSLEKIQQVSTNLLDTSVSGIIKTFDLLRPIYKTTSSYGHFGRDIFPWEKIVNI